MGGGQRRKLEASVRPSGVGGGRCGGGGNGTFECDSESPRTCSLGFDRWLHGAERRLPPPSPLAPSGAEQAGGGTVSRVYTWAARGASVLRPLHPLPERKGDHCARLVTRIKESSANVRRKSDLCERVAAPVAGRACPSQPSGVVIHAWLTQPSWDRSRLACVVLLSLRCAPFPCCPPLCNTRSGWMGPLHRGVGGRGLAAQKKKTGGGRTPGWPPWSSK